MKIGLLSGHFIDKILNDSSDLILETVYGDIDVKASSLDDHEIFFINRHGKKADLPPHKINYRGNIQALSDCNVDYIVSLGTVGSLNEKINVGDIVIPNDFIDVTKTRVYSFFDNSRVHVDMSDSFCPSIRSVVNKILDNFTNLKYHMGGVYFVTEGPRLETKSEIRMFSSFADIVGMTLSPEVILAREKGICFVSICIVCNMAAGLQSSLMADEIKKVFNDKKLILSDVFFQIIKNVNSINNCKCKSFVSKASL
jgi:5'-methylthioadenosine phosphorylase